MQTLAETLREIRERGEAKRPPEWTAVMKETTAELQASGITDGIPTVGDQAPHFARPDLEGQTVRLSSLLRNGPAVVSFFRGRW